MLPPSICRSLIHRGLSALRPVAPDSAKAEAVKPTRVSKVGHPAFWQMDILIGMGEDIHILKVEKDSEDGLIVTFSDGTIAGYVVEELLLLRPSRERVEEPVASNKPTHQI